MLFGKKKVNQYVTAEVSNDKFITKSEVTKHEGGDVTFDVPEDYAGCLVYGKESYVFFDFDTIIPQVSQSCFLPKNFFTLGDTFKFYLINLNYKFDTIKTAVLDQYYYKEQLPGVEIKCTFRIDLHVQLNSYNLDNVKKIIRTNANNLDSLNQIIQSNVAPTLKTVVTKYIVEELALAEHKYEEFVLPQHTDAVQAKVVQSLKSQLAPFGVRPTELTISIFTPQEGEQRLTKINDLMFDKVIDQLEHEFHDPARADLAEDREHEQKMAQTNRSGKTSSQNKCPQCNNMVDVNFTFCPYCQKKLK